jgi:hypothetical protein
VVVKFFLAFLLLAFLTGLTVFLLSGIKLEANQNNAISDDPPSPPAPAVCPLATQELPPKVDPVISPTNLSVQTITASFRAESMTVVNEVGSFKTMCNLHPCSVTILLKPDTVNHLTVIGKYALVTNFDGCVYGGYSIAVQSDLHGNPLEIEQVGGNLYTWHLPVVSR